MGSTHQIKPLPPSSLDYLPLGKTVMDLDGNTKLCVTLDDNLNSWGELEYTHPLGGEVDVLPLTFHQMDWVFQREAPPSGTFQNTRGSIMIPLTPDRIPWILNSGPFRCYEYLNATKQMDSSIDLELLDSKLPTINLSLKAWEVMRMKMNDFDDRILTLTHYDCGCPRYTHKRIFGEGYMCQKNLLHT